MRANYFFIDGSALTAQIRQLWRAHPEFERRKLCPRRFIEHFIRALPELHSGEYKRITFYFPVGDETAIEEYLVMPDHRRPGEIRDLHFKFCGHKLKKSAEFAKFVEESVPPKFQDRFAKSEKGIDIEMCCDALKLASAALMERLFLFSNDGDFIPFCKALKEFGANISILHLSEVNLPNSDLLREVDSYDVIPFKELQSMFLPVPTITPPLSSSDDEAVASAEKPDEPLTGIPVSEKPALPSTDMTANKDEDPDTDEVKSH